MRILISSRRFILTSALILSSWYILFGPLTWVFRAFLYFPIQQLAPEVHQNLENEYYEDGGIYGFEVGQGLEQARDLIQSSWLPCFNIPCRYTMVETPQVIYVRIIRPQNYFVCEQLSLAKRADGTVGGIWHGEDVCFPFF